MTDQISASHRRHLVKLSSSAALTEMSGSLSRTRRAWRSKWMIRRFWARRVSRCRHQWSLPIAPTSGKALFVCATRARSISSAMTRLRTSCSAETTPLRRSWPFVRSRRQQLRSSRWLRTRHWTGQDSLSSKVATLSQRITHLIRWSKWIKSIQFSPCGS